MITSVKKVPRKILRKVERVRRGPFTVVKHHNNISVTIQKGPCQTDTVNIRTLDPFFEQSQCLGGECAVKLHLRGSPNGDGDPKSGPLNS